MRNVDVMEHKIHTHNDTKQQQAKHQNNSTTKQHNTNDTKQKQTKQ